MTTQKLDLYRVRKEEYVTPKQPRLVETHAASYLAIDGTGEPGSKEFSSRIGPLMGVAYTVKMAKKAAGQDYKVSSLEARYWIGDAEHAELPRAEWRFQLMILTPDFVTQKDVDEAVEELRRRGKDALSSEVRLERIDEGTCVQVLHVGPYGGEDAVIAAMAGLAEERGLHPNGAHHEIYLSNPGRVPPERLRTILRQPVAG